MTKVELMEKLRNGILNHLEDVEDNGGLWMFAMGNMELDEKDEVEELLEGDEDLSTNLDIFMDGLMEDIKDLVKSKIQDMAKGE